MWVCPSERTRGKESYGHEFTITEKILNAAMDVEAISNVCIAHAQAAVATENRTRTNATAIGPPDHSTNGIDSVLQRSGEEGNGQWHRHDQWKSC